MPPQGEKVHYPAGIIRRLLAYLLDIIPILIILTLIYTYYFGFDDLFRERMNKPRDINVRTQFLDMRNEIRNFSFIILILYSLFMECSPLQGTLGKVICGMKVVDNLGNRLTFWKSVHRNMSKLLSYLIIFIGFIWALTNRDHQTWHDKIAKTFVVLRKCAN